MPYRFATENVDYSDYSSGRVLYSAPGHPAFPVRLISEVFQRCQAIRQKAGQSGPVTVYDPCCGSGYQLSTLAYLHWAEIQTIIGSDIDSDILITAERNLALLTPAGLEKRAQELTAMLKQYGKASHATALESLHRFTHQQAEYEQIHPIKTHLFQADGLSMGDIEKNLKGVKVDIVLADVPYGNRSNWQAGSTDQEPLTQMLDALLPALTVNSVVAIMANKAQKWLHPSYQRRGRFQIGKRQIFLLQPEST
ncbi:MAG: 23S rRNA G2445 N2-methylase RlmL [Cellvibrionaceae bacterium]|jgi:23S rRNA G2445 N2-methylase RlmL